MLLFPVILSGLVIRHYRKRAPENRGKGEEELMGFPLFRGQPHLYCMLIIAGQYDRYVAIICNYCDNYFTDEKVTVHSETPPKHGFAAAGDNFAGAIALPMHVFSATSEARSRIQGSRGVALSRWAVGTGPRKRVGSYLPLPCPTNSAKRRRIFRTDRQQITRRTHGLRKYINFSHPSRTVLTNTSLFHTISAR